MRYWSKGLARRSALNIDWSEKARKISVEDGQALLASIMPIQRVRGELPPEGAQVIVAGDTQPPIVWRYISFLATKDFESIVKLATGPAMVKFLAGRPGGMRLFFRLARFLMVFSAKYVWIWLRVKLLRSGGSQEPAPPRSAPSAAPVGRLSPSQAVPSDDAQPGIRAGGQDLAEWFESPAGTYAPQPHYAGLSRAQPDTNETGP